MLLASEYTVKLSKRYFKILYLSAAFRETFVFLGMPTAGKDSLVHCNKAGKILFEKQFEHNVDSFGMLNDREAVVLETRKNKITVVDLETYNVTEFPHQFMFEESDQAEIDTFSETRLLCVRELGNYTDSRMKLSYFTYPLKEETMQHPAAVFEAKDDDWTYEYLMRRGNNHSMIIWFKARHDEQFEFKTFDLRDDPKGVYTHHKIKNTIGEPYGIARVECAVSNIWEVHRGQLLAVCISNKTESKCQNSAGVVNNNFSIDLDKKVVREAKFFFEKKYNDYLIDYHNLGPISMFRTFQFADGKALRTPVYYVNNETESIVAYDAWQCTYKTKYFIPGFDSSTLMQGEYQNGDVEQFTLKIKKVMDPKEISLHFMLHINEDFDDDLLQDALELLDFI